MKRKKQRRLLLILLILLAAVCVGYFFLLRYNKQQEEAAETEEEDTSITIYPEDFDSSAITALSYYYEGEPLSFSLHEEEETWQYDADTKFPLNQSSLTGMSTQLQSLTASRQVQDNLDNAADYGLDDPIQQVTATDSDGTKFTIYFGDTNDAANVTYIYTSSSEAVYTIDSGLQDYFTHSLLEMIVEDELPEPDATAVFQNITITQGEKTNTFEYKEDGDLSMDYLNRCSWFVDMDGEQFAADDASISDLTSVLSSLSTSGCAAYDISEEEKAQYGLDEPSAVITMNYTQQETVESEEETSEAFDDDTTTASESDTETEAEETEETEAETVEVPYRFTLTIGDSVGDYYYVTWNDISQVYLMSKSTLDTLLNCEKSSLVYMEPFHFMLSSISSMEVKYQDLTFDYKITTSTETVETTDEDGETTTEEQEVTTYSLNEEEIESAEFTDLFSILQDASAEKLYPADEEHAPVGDEAVTITFSLDRKERSQVEMILTPYDNNYYALYVDGTPVYLMNKNDVADFIAALPITR